MLAVSLVVELAWLHYGARTRAEDDETSGVARDDCGVPTVNWYKTKKPRSHGGMFSCELTENKITPSRCENAEARREKPASSDFAGGKDRQGRRRRRPALHRAWAGMAKRALPAAIGPHRFTRESGGKDRPHSQN